MFDRFSRQAKSCLQRAGAAGSAAGSAGVGPDLLLGAVLGDPECAGSCLLRNLGIDPDDLWSPRAAGPGGASGPAGRVELTAATRRALETSLDVAQRCGHDHIGTGHILLGIASCGDAAVARLRDRIDACPEAEAALAAVLRRWDHFPDERGSWWRRVLRGRSS